LVFTSVIKKANNDSKVFLADFIPITQDLPDGIYKGKYKAFKFFTLSKVEFVIEAGMVENFTLDKLFRSPGSQYKEDIENRIRQSKRLEIDAISGATRTSNFANAAIKSALYNKVK